jgi:hypothetical protein
MKLVIAALLIALAANTAALAQYVLDAKGRRYRCLPGDWSCTVPPPPSAPVQPLRHPRPRPPKVEECGSRCDLLDRMK